MTEHWVLVTASREWRDRERVRASFLAVQRRLDAPAGAVGIVHGAARGGDRLADEVAAALGWVCDPVPCTPQEWARYGRSAGHQRNARMISRRAYVGCVAFPLGLSAGTRGCMVAAADAGLQVWNRGGPALVDGLYRVTHGKLCAGFEVRRGVVVECAPILRRQLVRWWDLAATGDPAVQAVAA
ncbi:MAG: SLOG family protein [Pseudonocardiaceae bacterium]